MRTARFADKSASASRRRALPQPTELQRHKSNWRPAWSSIELETGTYQGAALSTSGFAALVLIAVRPLSVQGGRGRWKGCAEGAQASRAVARDGRSREACLDLEVTRVINETRRTRRRRLQVAAAPRTGQWSSDHYEGRSR